MRTYEDPGSSGYNPKMVEADRALGKVMAEIARDRDYPEFQDLVWTGDGPYEPHLVYRSGNTYLVVDTEVVDDSAEGTGTWGRELSTGQIAERGTREYLLAGIEDVGKRPKGRTIAADIKKALLANRVRYIQVSLTVPSNGQQDVKSVDLREFDIS